MKQCFKRSTAMLLCLAMLMGLFAGIPGLGFNFVNAADEFTYGEEVVQYENMLSEYNPSFEEYAIPNWTRDDGVVQIKNEDGTWSLQISEKDAAATSAQIAAISNWAYTASVQVKGAGKMAIVFYGEDGTVVDSKSVTANTTEWETLTVTANVP